MEREDQFGAVAALDDPTRWSLYQFVGRQGGSVTRDEAARALRISVKLAAFHLDKLVERGLLRVDAEVPHGIRRRVGRTPKRYARSDMEVALAVPERNYHLVGEILLDALAETEAAGVGESIPDRARRLAQARGSALGAAAREARSLGRPGPERTLAVAEDLLGQQGYEPAPDEGGDGLILRNCPFHAFAHRAPDLVCSLNAALINGMLRGLGNETVRADLQPDEHLCCVRVRPPHPDAG